MSKVFPYSYLNKRFIKTTDAKVSIMCKAIQYGLGCFTGVRGNWNKEKKNLYLFRLNDHYKRLKESAKIRGMKFNYTYPKFKQVLIDLAKKNMSFRGLPSELMVMNGEALEFHEASFDVVYAHGVIQYTADARKMIDEAFRVLKPGGVFIGMVYNRKGWLNVMSKFFKVGLEHEDAPVLRKYTIGEFRKLLAAFSEITILPERFPVKSRLHGGLKGVLFNTVFVGTFNLIPRSLVRKTGWHIMAWAIK